MKLDNNKKSKLLMYIVIATIALLLVGVIYQFVCIKQLEHRVNNLEASVQIELRQYNINLKN